MKKLALLTAFLLFLTPFCYPAADVTLDQASDIETDTSSFGGNLSAADTDVQKALDTLDNLDTDPAFGTTTQIPYMNAGGTDFLYSANNLFDGNSLLPANIVVTPAALGSEKITNGSLTVTTGWTLAADWSNAYVFTVSGITTTPTTATYTNNGVTFTVRYTRITGTAPNKAGFMVCTGSSSPVTSGTLTKASGTGDNSIAFSAVTTGAAYHITTGTGTLSQASASMVTPLVAGEWYELSFTVLNKSSAAMSCAVTCGGATVMTATADGNYKQTFRATSTADLTFTPGSANRFGIDTVSLKKATGIIQGSTLHMSGAVGSTPASGAGTRLMWIPEKAAFRCGKLETYPTYWDDQNIGVNSIGMGNDCLASGSSSLAFGQQSFATAANSYAIGDNNSVSQDNACAVGIGNVVSGMSSYAFGSGNTVTAMGGTAVGIGCTVYGGGSNVSVGSSLVQSTLGSGVSVGQNTIWEGGYGATAVGNSCGIGVEGDSDYGVSSTVVGYASLVSGNQSTGIGVEVTVSSDYSFGIGYQSTTSGLNSGVIGLNLTASGTGTIAVGYGYTEATDASFNWGYGQRDFQLTSANAIFGAGLAGVDYTVSFPGETNSGEFKWMEDEDYFSFTDKVLLADKLIFTQTDGNEYIDSLNDGYMDYGATTGHRFNSTVTITGSLNSTGTRVTKGWFTDLEVTNAIAGSITGNAATVTVADTTDTTCNVALFEDATGSLGAKTDAGLTYNAGTGVLTATGFSGPLTGNVTGNVSGSSGSCTGNAATCTTASAGDSATDFFGAGSTPALYADTRFYSVESLTI